MGGGSRIAPANDAPSVFFHAGAPGSFHRHVSPRPSFGGLAAVCVLAGGFPRVLFSPCGVLFPSLWCFPPRCAGAVPPCGLSTPRVALLSWDHLAAFGRRHARLGLAAGWPPRARHSCTHQHFSRDAGWHTGQPTSLYCYCYLLLARVYPTNIVS